MSESRTSGCLSGFASCLKATASMCTIGDEVLEVIELADPNPVDKAIYNTIQALMKISAKALLALSKACADKAVVIEEKEAAELKKLGLLKKDGSISSLVSEVVGKTVNIKNKDEL